MDIFYIKRNDTSPSVEATLSAKGSPVDLTGATVYFHMSDGLGGLGTIVDPSTGKVRYDWQAGDTATAGVYYSEWEVVYADGKKETFPNDGYSTIKILEDLGEP